MYVIAISSSFVIIYIHRAIVSIAFYVKTDVAQNDNSPMLRIAARVRSCAVLVDRISTFCSDRNQVIYRENGYGNLKRTFFPISSKNDDDDDSFTDLHY